MSLRHYEIPIPMLIALMTIIRFCAVLTARAEIPLPPMMLGSNAQASGPESICRILIFNKQKKLQHVCSGTLIQSDQILTAGHCFMEFSFAKKDDLRIECGFIKDSRSDAVEKDKTGLGVHISGPVFKETLDAKEILFTKEQMSSKKPRSQPSVGNDQAIIRLTKDSSLSPMPRATQAERDAFFPNQGAITGIECYSAGFGLQADGTVGILNNARIPSSLERAACRSA